MEFNCADRLTKLLIHISTSVIKIENFKRGIRIAEKAYKKEGIAGVAM